MIVNIAIIDDNSIFADNLAEEIKNYIYIEYSLDIFANGNDFAAASASKHYHILFMDILLDAENGIETAKQIKQRIPDINIIFISVERNFFMDVYSVDHMYFLTKPIDSDHLQNAINICVENINANSLTFFHKNRSVTLKLNEIVFIENYVKTSLIHYRDNSSSVITMPLREFDNLLREHTNFIRTHQSYIVNLSFMEKYIRRKSIVMPNNVEVPISRKYSSDVDNMITRFLGNI